MSKSIKFGISDRVIDKNGNLGHVVGTVETVKGVFKVTLDTGETTTYRETELSLAPIVPTGWIRYRIWSSRGGSTTKDHWIYLPGYDVPEEIESAHEQIISTRESWAQHAESYHLDTYLGEMPPRELIEKRIKSQQRNIEYIQEEIVTLKGQLNGRL